MKGSQALNTYIPYLKGLCQIFKLLPFKLLSLILEGHHWSYSGWPRPHPYILTYQI